MMRYLGIVTMVALLATPAFANFSDNFDSYAIGNLSNQGSWTKGSVGTSWIQVAANPLGAGNVVKIRGGDTGSGDRTVGSEDAGIMGMTGIIRVEFDILKGENIATSWGVLADDDGNPDGNLARAYGTGSSVRGRIDGQGIVTGQDQLALAGWNHIKIVIDTAANTDTFYQNGTLLTGTNPISHAGFAGDILQRISFHKVNGAASQDVYLDNISITPEPATLALLGLGTLLLGRRRR